MSLMGNGKQQSIAYLVLLFRYRLYEEDPQDRIQKRVKMHYEKQHTLQTVDFVEGMHKKWLGFTHANMTIMECLELLSGFLDESDPDVDEPNLLHAYQTAERLRVAFPSKPWMHLAGLVHDLGKVLSMWGEEQFAVTGDTYAVGCAPSDTIVYGLKSFELCSDQKDDRYNTKYGIYTANCGLEKLMMTWGHDEYMYRVLVNHGSTLPEEALYAIRFHSFYPYHSHEAYRHLSSEKDDEMMGAIKMLNQCDLYSKSDGQLNIDELKSYYQSLIDEYCPGKIAW
ncbi:hypothetical protein PMAYCL1PPCAC_18486 [Pristionchus mayeri]|uniref:Inositol oxygenase n=1 Tax=Pristionchus mayeri TaxID=1317129 RepID=A0AAN5CPH2_9BILA|nr:hypothetical protein PMAYCL1PPCAC_18486 [Pristionchus mayeri]